MVEKKFANEEAAMYPRKEREQLEREDVRLSNVSTNPEPRDTNMVSMGGGEVENYHLDKDKGQSAKKR